MRFASLSRRNENKTGLACTKKSARKWEGPRYLSRIYTTLISSLCTSREHSSLLVLLSGAPLRGAPARSVEPVDYGKILIPELRLHGVKNLWIRDGFILPTHPSKLQREETVRLCSLNSHTGENTRKTGYLSRLHASILSFTNESGRRQRATSTVLVDDSVSASMDGPQSKAW